MPKNPEVDAWLAGYDNPMKPVVERVRRIVLGADRRIGECIKWQAPTFTYEGNLASFNPRSKKHASLMFHTGATIPGRHPKLQGGGGTARYMTFATVADANAAKKDLEAVVAAWCAMKGDGATTTTAATKAAKEKPSTRKTASKKASKATRKKTATRKKATATKATTKKTAARKTSKKR